MSPLVDPSGRPVAAPSSTAPAARSAQSGGAAPSPSQDPNIKDSSIATFAADVLQASLQVPVIVDFWAPWCGPCKTLGPQLEAAVTAAKGAVKLVKINIDENPELAQQLRIQSIPTVYAFKNGQPVDGFAGAIPESQIRAFVAGLLGGAAAPGVEDELAAADAAFAAGDLPQAAQIYGQILQEDPGSPKAVAGLAKCYLASGDVERAQQTLGLVRPDGEADEAVRAVQAELALKKNAGAVQIDLAALRAKSEADPADPQAAYDLALGLEASGDRDGSIAALLDIIKRHKKWNEDAARKQLLTLFEAMGHADPRTIEARRKLSTLLFS